MGTDVSLDAILTLTRRVTCLCRALLCHGQVPWVPVTERPASHYTQNVLTTTYLILLLPLLLE